VTSISGRYFLSASSIHALIAMVPQIIAFIVNDAPVADSPSTQHCLWRSRTQPETKVELPIWRTYPCLQVGLAGVGGSASITSSLP
jgi:hypothetical protein